MIAVHAMTLEPMVTLGTVLLAWFSLHQRMSAMDTAVADASTRTFHHRIGRQMLSLPS